MAVSCAGPAEESKIGSVESELTPGSILGFENASQWHGPGQLSVSSARTEGDFSLATRPSNYSVYESDPFAFSGKARQVLVDLQLPTTQPNPWWYGAVQLYLESPSANVYNAYVGQVELTGRPLGVFNTLKFDVPDWISSRIAGGGFQDLKIKIAINVPGSPGVYLLDNLRIQTELLLHYEFDKLAANGTVIDSSGYGRHGTLRGPATLSSNGREGSALGLNGDGGYLELPDGVLDGVKNVTIATWVNLSRVDAWSRIFDVGSVNGGFLFVTPSTHDGFLRYSSYTGFGNEGIVTAPALTPGAWKHVAITSTGRDYRIYIDGVEAGNALTVPVPPADLGATIQGWIGRSRFPDPFLSGHIDDFRIYDRVLSQREIASLAKPQRDYANYRFDEKSGNVIADSSELRLNGSLSGAAARVQGVIDGALELKGTGGHVTLPGGVVETCNDLTVTSWVKLKSNQPWNRVFDFGNPDATSFMYLSPAGFGAAGQELRFGLISPRGVHDVGFPFAMPLEEWTHLGVVLRDDTATLFLNGRAVTRQSGIVSNPSDMGRTIGNFVGKSTFAGDPTFDGALDDLRVSCRAFDDREIAQLAHRPAPATLPNQIDLSGAIVDVHDPAMIQAGGKYHLFSTGPGIMTRTSNDLRNWSFTGSVFPQHPQWVTDRLGPIDALWAPDISFFGGKYHLYYSASTFGSNRSCIGHATKDDLSSSAPWTDHGPAICSNMDGNVDDWNAIDPNVIVDQQGTPWLSFGSFWSGIKMVRLDGAGARADNAVLGIASRPDTSVEAPYIVYRAPYYYMFASFDFCCRGTDSTYRTVVGRSSSVTGPYLDRTGLDMRFGGGTPVVTGDSRWRGTGHNAILKRNGEYLNIYHAYDALNNGIPTLRISELVWQDGWPINAQP